MAGFALGGVGGGVGKESMRFSARKALPGAPQRPFRALTHLLSQSIPAGAQGVLGARVFWMCQK